MNNQNRYALLFVVIFAIGISTYFIFIPSFETTEFNTEVVEDISNGITTTSTTTKSSNNQPDNLIVDETTDDEGINIPDQNTVNDLIKFSNIISFVKI